MKNRFISVIIAIILLSGAVLPTAVSASVPWFHAESMKFEAVDSEIVTISMDIRKTKEMCYMFTLSSPKNADDPYSTVTWLNLLSFTLTSDGDFRASVDGAWFNEESNGISVGKFDADGEWHNVILKVMLNKKTIEMFLDSELVHTFNLETRILNTAEVAPCNMITVSGDSTYKNEKGYEANIVSVIGAKEHEIGVNITEHNEEEKTITVGYTSRLFDKITSATLKKTDVIDGETEIPLYVISSGEYETVFGYDDEIEGAKEYALILPDDIKGENGEEMSTKYLYFSVHGNSSMMTVKSSDYTAFDKDVDIKLQPGNNWNNRKPNSYNGYFEVFSWQGPYAGGAQHWHATLNWDTLDSNIIPTGDKVSEISFDIIPKKADMSYGFSLTHTIRNNMVRNNGLEISFDEAGNIISSCGVLSYGWSMLFSEDWEDSIIGRYEVDVPINIKYVIDKPDKKVYLYLNNELKRTVDETATSASKLHTSENSYLTLYEMFGHENKNIYEDRETLFLLDNVKLEVLKEMYDQPSVRFYEVGGAEKGAYDEISRKIDRITVNFGREIDENSLDFSTVSVLYDGEIVEYTTDDAIYDAENFTYTIYPDFIPGNNEKIEVLCDGVVDLSGESVDAFKVYATADNLEGVSVDNFYAVDEDGKRINEIDGEIYVNALVTNMESEDREVLISFMGYKDDTLEKLEFVKEYVDAGAKYTVTNIENIIGMDTAELDRIEISVQDAVSGEMLCHSYILGEETNTGKNIYEGRGATPYDYILVEVYAPEMSSENLGDTIDFRDVLLYKATTIADKNGNFKICFNADYVNAVSGIYNVFAYGYNYEKKDGFLYVNPATAESVLENRLIPAVTSGDLAGTAEIVYEFRYDLYIDDKYMNEEVAENAAKLIIEYENITNDNAKTVLNKAVAISAYELGGIDDIIGEAEIFNLDESDISEFYEKSYIDDVTKKNIVNRLKGVSFSSFEEFDVALKEAFILAVVANPVEPKSAMNVMKGLGLSGYSTKQYDYVSGKYYKNITELKNALDSHKPAAGGGSSGGGGGGSSSAGGKTQNIVIAPPETENKESNAEYQNVKFKDISSVAWAEEAIIYLADTGVINGKAEGVFSPNDTVTREEFTKMIVVAFDINANVGQCEFSDVNSNEWYAKYIDIAYSAGIIKGYSSKAFGVGECITREDMAVIICRAAEKAGIKLKGDRTTAFVDDGYINDYALESVYKLKNTGIVNGKEGNLFAPKAFATRAEAAKMIYGLIAA